MDYQIELVHLKQDIFDELKKLDKKFTDLHQENSKNIPKDILTPLDKINIMLNKTEQMFLSVTEQQIKLDKITELETFKNKANDIIISHDIRINSLIKDVENAIYKYDREISQNLTVPGFIGTSSRFKTLSEYLLYNIDEMAKLKMEKDLMKKEEKELKSKIDSIVKNILNVVENSIKRANLYTDNKLKNFDEVLNNKYKEFKEKIMEMKTQFLSNEKFIKEEIDKINKVFKEINYLKENIETIMNKSEIKSFMNEIKNKVDKINNEVKKNRKNIDNINNMLKTNEIMINNVNNVDNYETKNKLSHSKRISLKRRSEINNNNYNYRNNNLIKSIQSEKNYIKENITNLNNQKISNSFKVKKNKEINEYTNQKKVEKNNSNEILKKFDNNKKESIINNNKPINTINKNNIKTYNDLKHLIKPKLIKDKENKNNDIIESYSIESKIQTERKIININKDKSNRKKIDFNNKINLSDGEKEKKIIKIDMKKKNVKNNKIDKHTIIKIEGNKTFEKFKKENIQNNIINHTDYNFYHKKNLNDFHYFKNEIYNLKRIPIHKKYKEENSEDNSRKANSEINFDINLDNITPNHIQSIKKVNNIYYPNKEMIKNMKQKKFILNQFLIRNNINYNNKSNSKYSRLFLNEDNNQIYETINSVYNRSNTLDKVHSPPPLIKDNDYNKIEESQSYIKNKNEKNNEKFNFKFISLDNQFKMALNKKKTRFRNNPELLLSVPITNVFKTFQMRKNKEMNNNKNYMNFGQSFNNKIEDKKS